MLATWSLSMAQAVRAVTLPALLGTGVFLTLRKAGRLSNLKALVANTLNIKPVMGSTKEGTIQQLGQARGMKKALTKMIQDMLKVTKNCENRILAISHCNCPERAHHRHIHTSLSFPDIDP